MALSNQSRRPSWERPLYDALRSVVVSATQTGRTLLRARVIYRDTAGRSYEEPIIVRRLGEHELRPLEAIWRIERLDEQGRRRGRFIWLDAVGEPA
jgi:hypothetical protein